MRRAGDYKFFAEFQSHEPEFDYLKSLEIEEKINAIKWCPRVNNALFLLATNGESAVGFDDSELYYFPVRKVLSVQNFLSHVPRTVIYTNAFLVTHRRCPVTMCPHGMSARMHSLRPPSQIKL